MRVPAKDETTKLSIQLKAGATGQLNEKNQRGENEETSAVLCSTVESVIQPSTRILG